MCDAVEDPRDTILGKEGIFECTDKIDNRTITGYILLLISHSAANKAKQALDHVVFSGSQCRIQSIMGIVIILYSVSRSCNTIKQRNRDDRKGDIRICLL